MMLLRTNLRPLGLAALMVVLVVLAYLPARRGDFVWDDDRYLTGNSMLQSGDGLRRIWLTFEAWDYYPVTYTSFWIDRRLWGDAPAPYHAVNVVLHALASVVLWRVLVRLAVPGALLAALLFGLHPINVESVAWISQRKNTLAMFCFAVSVWCYLRGLRTDDPRRVAPGGTRWYAAALAAFGLSLLSKPLAIAWPVCVVAHGWWQDGRVRRQTWLRALPFAVVSAAVALVTLHVQQTHSLGAGEAIGAPTPGGRCVQALGAWLFYLRQIVVPGPGCAIYPVDTVDLLSPGNVALLTGLVCGGVAVWQARPAWRRHLCLGFAWYTAMLLPVLGFTKIGFLAYAPVADHWAYAAAPAILALLCAAATPPFRRAGRRHAVAGGVLAAAVVALAGGLTWSGSAKYQSLERLFRDVVRQNPQAWVAHVQLGYCAARRHDLGEAEYEYGEALRIKPDACEALVGLGAVAIGHGDFAAGIARFEEALRIKPSDAEAARCLALARRTKPPAALEVPVRPWDNTGHGRL